MKQRIVTGLIAAVVFLTALYLGHYAFSILVLAMALVGLFEFNRMNQIPFLSSLSIISLIIAALILIPFENHHISFISNDGLVWILMFLLFSITVISKNKVTLDQVALTVLGTFYVAIGFASMIDVRNIEFGLIWCLLAFCTIWASDTGAYFAGKAFGKRKLWPSISPNKTIEGSIGGIICSVIVGGIFSLVFDPISLQSGLLIGLVSAVVGQMGDLIQSAYKRVRGIKDIGKLLPGHGGILDRCDSWIIVFPILVYSGLIPV
jgi:phosphatidate cytidylyltransferase